MAARRRRRPPSLPGDAFPPAPGTAALCAVFREREDRPAASGQREPKLSRRYLLAFVALFAAASSAASDPVRVTGGLLKGTTHSDTGVRIYRGIPFAAAPIGDRRWKPPAPPEPWDGIREADEWGARCTQGTMFGSPLVTRDEAMQEDCLYLNVWTPARAADEKLPVLVVFHGGGFASGSASEPRTDGEWFAEQGIVVVEPNYRLGLFGFLAHPELSDESGGRGSGAYGLLDQVAALEWVHNNVAAFGGDPNNVTINGESAGSLSVSAHMASPLSRDLVHKAIGQSGAFLPSPSDSMALTTLAEKERDGIRFAESVGAESLADLRRMPADELLEAVMSRNAGWGWGPGVDGYFLDRPVAEVYAAGNQADIPLLAGWTSAELGTTIAFAPDKPTVDSFAAGLADTFGERAAQAAEVYRARTDEEAMRAAAALASDLFIAYSTWKWIEVHAATGSAPVYRYRFDRTIPSDPASRFGAIHAADIEYAFNTLPSKQADWQPADRRVATTMATAFANFVRTGNPNGDGVPRWPEFGASGQVMVFDSVPAARPEEFRARYEFLDSVD